MPVLSGCPAAFFPHLRFHILGETVDYLRLVEQSAVKSGTGVWRLPETWCARLPARLQHRTNGGRDWACGLVPASGVFCQNGSLFPQTVRLLRLVSTLKPLHIVIHSLTCSTLVAVCGTFRRRTMRLWK